MSDRVAGLVIVLAVAFAVVFYALMDRILKGRR